jgi:hypothetical protein
MPHPRAEAAATGRLRAWRARGAAGAAALLEPDLLARLAELALRDEPGAAAALSWIVGLD